MIEYGEGDSGPRISAEMMRGVGVEKQDFGMIKLPVLKRVVEEQDAGVSAVMTLLYTYTPNGSVLGCEKVI